MMGRAERTQGRTGSILLLAPPALLDDHPLASPPHCPHHPTQGTPQTSHLLGWLHPDTLPQDSLSPTTA